ncbi:hypothetical protein JCGZ_12406 [Jatropha curcas]|uniref:Uncharacterized protein n=1 Tax=Jatropha curcas TaxID=180498 RepID=A0A067KI45_JATCU|nr:hypothetical protein JCGZ_12406 [Jatropha curcas]
MERGLFANNPEVANITINSTRDTDGHGTHTSSTAAGNFVKGASYFGYASGTSRGMAPRARIATYKAIWRSGVFESDVLAAVDQAIHDGVDILSLSLTLADDDMFLEDDSIAIASFSAIEKGIFVAAAAGNDGPSFYTLVNGAPWLLTVGAGTVDRELHGILTLGDKTQFSFPTLYPGNFSLSQRTLVFLDGCESVQEMKKYKHDIIVCKDNLSFSSQYENAESANVAAAVFITDITRLNYYTPSPFPAAFIGVQDGQKVINYMTSSNDPKASLQFQKTIVGTKPAPKVASYSARGPFTKCKYVLKPDIIAPGSSILASWSPVSSVTKVRKHDLFSKFNLDSGTSMATPHVAGVAALVKKMHPDWSPAAIRSALMTSANPLDNTNSPIKDEADDKIPAATPLDIGAGHIDPNKALEPGLIYDAKTEDYIKFLCAMNLTKKQIQFITRSSHHNCLNKSLDLNYPSFIAYFTGDESKSNGKMVVQEFPRTVTNVGEGISNYTAKLTKMNGIKVSVEPQKLAFKKKNEKLRYKLIIEGPKLLEEDVVYGSLSWVHDGGKYVVRSPIVATNLVP